MNIGFDLDKIFINHPPLMPAWLMSKLYGEKSNGHLTYRIPGKFEQYIRKLSHLPFLRQPIQENIRITESVKKNPNLKFFLISSRYSFLKNETNNVIEENKLKKIFTKMYFNFQNEQPHEFKDKIITQLHINKYVDDDLPLLTYLANKHPEISFFWLTKSNPKRIQKNLSAINNLSEIFKKI